MRGPIYVWARHPRRPRHAGQRERQVYLPGNGLWYDFWTGAAHPGQQTVTVSAPLDRLPLFVRAGSVLPLANVVTHLGEPQQIETIRIYPGADGRFDLALEDGATYEYETTAPPHLVLSWQDASGELNVEQPAGLSLVSPATPREYVGPAGS